jgi:hypothetical protein
MNVKTRLFSICLAFTGSALLIVPPTHAFELECGTYELVGRFDRETGYLWMSEGTDSQRWIFLYGSKIVTGFSRGSDKIYRVKAEVRRHIGDSGGQALLVEVIGVDHIPPTARPYRLLHAQKCSART